MRGECFSLPVVTIYIILARACDSVKGVLETVNEKGFLWCLMNAEKLDFLIKDCDGTLEKMFRVIYVRFLPVALFRWCLTP